MAPTAFSVAAEGAFSTEGTLSAQGPCLPLAGAVHDAKSRDRLPASVAQQEDGEVAVVAAVAAAGNGQVLKSAAVAFTSPVADALHALTTIGGQVQVAQPCWPVPAAHHAELYHDPEEPDCGKCTGESDCGKCNLGCHSSGESLLTQPHDDAKSHQRGSPSHIQQTFSKPNF